MIRNQLLALLDSYTAFTEEEAKMQVELSTFVKSHPDCFERSLLIGHVTGSAFVVNKERTHSLLMHHSMLGIWVQPGGHCDGHPDVAQVAMKEAVEETGLENLTIESDRIFDLDIHWLPERKSVPGHYHYDVRFLIEADINEELMPNEESIELKWVPLNEITKYNEDSSVLRMKDKLPFLSGRL